MTRIASSLGRATAPPPEGRSESLHPHHERPRPSHANRVDGSSAYPTMRLAWKDSGADSCSAPLLPLSSLTCATIEVSRRIAANLHWSANQLLRPYTHSRAKARCCRALTSSPEYPVLVRVGQARRAPLERCSLLYGSMSPRRPAHIAFLNALPCGAAAPRRRAAPLRRC